MQNETRLYLGSGGTVAVVFDWWWSSRACICNVLQTLLAEKTSDWFNKVEMHSE